MDRKYLVACIAGISFVAVSGFAVEWSDPHSVVEAALAASPALRVARARLAMARAREGSAGIRPNPVLVAGAQNQQIDLSTDPMMTMYIVGASQTLVRSERREALKRAASLDVQQIERQLESRRAEIIRDVLVAYYEATAAENQIGANEEIAKLSAVIADAARIRYETGSAPQIDIIRARLDESNLRHELLMQDGIRDQALARLRALLALPPEAEIPSLAMQHAMERQEPAGDRSLNVSTPAIDALEAEVSRAEEEIHLARLLTKPDVNIEASYGFRPQQKDMFSLLGRIELPIRKAATIEPRIAEAIARRDEARAEIDLLRLELQRDFGVALAQRREATEQINLHVERLVPEAKVGFESALTSYQAGKTTFDSVLAALQTYKTLNIDYFDFLRKLLVAGAELDAIQHGATSSGSGSAANFGGAR